MKKIVALIAVLSLSAVSSPLVAGVVLTQQIVTDNGSGAAKEDRTVMVEGNKQKVIMRAQTIVLDLDGGRMLLMDPRAKAYTALPFPPTGPMASMMQNMGGVDLDFKKTGAAKTMAGYQCQEYDSAGRSMMGEFTAKGCFSSDAPGAAEYSAFTKQLAKKFQNAGMAKTTGNQPEGVPLVLETTTKITNFEIPGMPPEQAARLKQMMANRPPTSSKSTTTSIKTAQLPADTFAIPAGFTERRIDLSRTRGPAGGGAPGAMPTPYEGE